MKSSFGFSTKAVHSGHDANEFHGAVNTPIFMSSTYEVKNLSNPSDGSHLYGRFSNPTRKSLEDTFASLENAKHALAYPSGMSAIGSIIETLLKPGDHIICSHDCYGGTSAFLKIIFERSNIDCSLVDTTKTEEITHAINERTKMVLFESITNPMMKITDIEKVVEVINKERTSRNRIFTVVDNTFMTPYFLNPLNLGADIVVHSVTKFMNGHSDVIMGAVMLNDEETYQKLKFNHFHCGTTPSPFDCFLVSRGLKTLALRMRQHSENSKTIAQVLDKHPAVEKVIYPGLKSHPQHELGRKLSPKGFPGMIAVQLKLDNQSHDDESFKKNVEKVEKFISKLKLFTLAVSLGAVESLVDVPVLMTQGCNGVSRESLAERGINIGLIRLSVGVEDVDDLTDDLVDALDTLTTNEVRVNGCDHMNGKINGDMNGTNGSVISMLKHNLSRTKLSSPTEQLCHSNQSVNVSSKILSTF